MEFFKPLFLYSVSFVGFLTIDLIMAKAYLNGLQAGYYAAASQISKIILVIATSFNTMLLPYMTERFLKKKAILKQFLRIEVLFLLLALSVILMFILFPNQIISFSYTAKYAKAKELLLPLGMATALMAISSMTGMYMLSIGKYRVFILSVLMVLIEVVLIYCNHDSALGIAQMFLISQIILVTMFKIALFITKPANINAP
jgi:O-antigen/teichoic acid export membrane protein